MFIGLQYSGHPVVELLPLEPQPPPEGEYEEAATHVEITLLAMDFLLGLQGHFVLPCSSIFFTIRGRSHCI